MGVCGTGELARDIETGGVGVCGTVKLARDLETDGVEFRVLDTACYMMMSVLFVVFCKVKHKLNIF